MNKQALLLLILDGWGVAPDNPENAITQADTPQWDRWLKEGTVTTLNASGEVVGLPDNQMGNSEVGHMHIGAGRIIEQDLTRINHAIEEGHFFKHPLLIDAIKTVQNNKKKIHLLGLLSDGGVHSHQSHLFALVELLEQQGISDALIHAFLDGRDTAPKSALEMLKRCQETLSRHPVAKIASLAGRFYAMDRDKRWERTEAVYECLTQQEAGELTVDAIIQEAYESDLTDEFVPPTPTLDYCPIQEGDLVIFFNFRSDRARQLCHALTDETFTPFDRTPLPKLTLLTMTEYAKEINASVIFPKPALKQTLGECIEAIPAKQLRIAETEKYAHVTFFFNGGNETVLEGEDRILVPSPKVKTYDLKPEMSANEVCDKLIEALNSQEYTLLICNFANADMVGHTGQFDATVKAIETLDHCFEKINTMINTLGMHLLVTADHGNAEKMFNASNQQIHTAHTSSPVPFIHIGPTRTRVLKDNGTLIDIAPTALHLLQLPVPNEMTGTPVFSEL